MDEVIKAAEWVINSIHGRIYKEIDKDGSFVKKEIVNMSSSLLDVERPIKASRENRCSLESRINSLQLQLNNQSSHTTARTQGFSFQNQSMSPLKTQLPPQGQAFCGKQ
jgi:CII-binding regulator of phage lambda lysogenization HflD